MLLAIDPGADAGWALLGDDKLLAAGLNEGALREAPTRAVIERPMIYPGGRQKARPADVIKLAVRAGEWGGRISERFGIEPEYVEPHTWKGTVPKEIHQARIWAKLDASERTVLDKAGSGIAPSKRHNIVDAVGLALYSVGR